jgi:exodeoxyribonuclease-5
MRLTDGQQAAFDAVMRWLPERAKPFFTIHGFAGTGKTTLVRTIADHLGERAILCTITGKAASVLRRKTGHPVHTIHGLAYSLGDKKRLAKRKHQMSWHALQSLNSERYAEDAVLIVDECSMVNERIARDLLSHGLPVLALGDPGQLPPVGGEPFFTDPDVTLTEIVRQAKGNPIIAASQSIRERGVFTAAPGFVDHCNKNDVPDDAVLGSDVILVYKNDTRRQCNDMLRKAFGYVGDLPQYGEKVLCLRNNHDLELYNGAVYEVEDLTEKPFDQDSYRLTIRDGARRVTVDLDPAAFFDTDFAPDHLGLTPFDFGYALTVHKAQGSEWERVLLIDEWKAPHNPDYRKWMYTAITRAAQSVVIAR